MSMTDHISMLFARYVTEWRMWTFISKIQTLIEVCIKEGMDDAVWIYFLSHFLFIYFVHKEFPYDG